MRAQIEVGVLVLEGSSQTGEPSEMVVAAAERALDHAGYHSVTSAVIEANQDSLKAAILRMCETCDLVFTAGGVGFAPMDVVPEVTQSLIERQAYGLSDLIRQAAHRHTETSHLNRGVAGIRGQTVIVNLGGSPDAAREGIETVSLLIRPMLSSLKGEQAPEHVA